MDPNFAEIFADKIIKKFMGAVQLRMLDPILEEQELPIEFIIDKKFMMVDEFFKNDICKLPLILNKIAGESEATHQERVKMYLLACPDTKFSEIAEIINPENVFHQGFFNLYNEVTKIRAERGK